MAILRRAGIVAAAGRRAARARLPLRARLPGPGGLSRAAARRGSRPPTSACPTSRCSSSPTGCRCPPGSSRPGTAHPARASSWSTAGSRPATGPCRWPPFLHAAGFHCLTFDVRGHGANPAEDAAAQRRRVRGRRAGRRSARCIERPEVTDRRRSPATRWAPSGRSSPGAADPRVAAVVATSARPIRTG